MQRPNLGHLEQPKRRQEDLLAMRQECFAKPIMTHCQRGIKDQRLPGTLRRRAPLLLGTGRTCNSGAGLSRSAFVVRVVPG